MAKITNVVNTVRVLTYIVLSSSFVLIESAPEGALVTQVPGFNDTFPSKHYSGYVTIDEAHGKNCFITLSSPKQSPPVIQSSSGSMVALATLASMDSSMSTQKEWQDAWDGLDEKEITIQEIEHDSFWAKLKMAAEKKVGAAKAEQFCKAFRSIHKKLVYEEMSLDAARSFLSSPKSYGE